MNCAICDKGLVFSWTDTHGVGQCSNCGTPYAIYHYENEKRVDKPVELCVNAEYVPVLRAYWAEAQRPIPSGYSMGSSYGTNYERATVADANAFNEWMKANADKHLAPVATTEATP